jgi:hypothetical protein
MDTKIIPLEGTFSPEEARDWEANIFHQVCSQAQKEATAYPASLGRCLVVTAAPRMGGNRLSRAHPGHSIWRSAYSPSVVSRSRGSLSFFAGEYLELKAYQAATPEMQAMCTTLAGHMSFRTAAGMLEEWLAGLLSHSSCCDYCNVQARQLSVLRKKR